MRRNISVIIVVIAAIAVMLIIGKHLTKRSNVTQTVNPGGPAIGSVAPEFELTSLDGKKVRLSDFRGKAVLLNFWATWCQPCRIEMPWFVELEKQYGPEGLQVVGVAMDDGGKSEVEKFAKQMGVNYLVLLGKESVGEAYGGVDYLPTTFYIDRDGRVVERAAGLLGRGEIEANVKRALNHPQLSVVEPQSQK